VGGDPIKEERRIRKMKANGVQTRSSIDRPALIGVALLGMAVCAPGIGRVATAGQWISPQGILGTLLGVAVLGIVGARIGGWSPFGITSDRMALAVVIAVAVVKVAIAAAVPL
jgi:hypothetical protein